MHYVFQPFSLYPERAELVGPEGVVKVEPKAFAVLRLLVEHHDRVVSREEMIEVIWGGRFISDAAVSTALKFARKAVGDDGERQVMIRTLHGAGHRFVARVERRVDATTVVQHDEPAPDRKGQRPTIAVLPLTQGGDDALHLGDGLADEIIASLSRLRWLRVIARESSFRLRQEGVDLEAMRGVLGAGYALSGRVERAGARLVVSVTLIDTANGAVVWADRFTPLLEDIHLARQDIVDAVVGALDLQIPQAEAMAARGKPTEALDAWGAYHLGMSHFYRLNAHDNAIASALFERATVLDPGFAMAFAARSFARFQDAGRMYCHDRDSAVADVHRMAARALELDPLDPFANMSMGRWSWLMGRPDDGLEWYERSIRLSPSYSKGHYSRGIVDAFAGRPEQARAGIDAALRLSPLDPLMGLMLSGKGLSYLVEGNYTQARDFCLRAARNTPSHSCILIGAVAACELADDRAQAVHWASVLRGSMPGASATMYLQAAPLADGLVRSRIKAALMANGVPE